MLAHIRHEVGMLHVCRFHLPLAEGLPENFRLDGFFHDLVPKFGLRFGHTSWTQQGTQVRDHDVIALFFPSRHVLDSAAQTFGRANRENTQFAFFVVLDEAADTRLRGDNVTAEQVGPTNAARLEDHELHRAGSDTRRHSGERDRWVVGVAAARRGADGDRFRIFFDHGNQLLGRFNRRVALHGGSDVFRDHQRDRRQMNGAVRVTSRIVTGGDSRAAGQQIISAAFVFLQICRDDGVAAAGFIHNDDFML